MPGDAPRRLLFWNVPTLTCEIANVRESMR
jgi:hypothetical protein